MSSSSGNSNAVQHAMRGGLPDFRRPLYFATASFAFCFAIGAVLSIVVGSPSRIWLPAAFTTSSVVAVCVLYSASSRARTKRSSTQRPPR
jgi:hypothetical protein